MNNIIFGSKSDIGLVREENQDSNGRFPAECSDETRDPGLLFVVADGMGGHRGGREASDIAVKTLSQEYFVKNGGSIPERLQHGFEKANSAVREYGTKHPEYRGMGTTLSVLVLHSGKAFIGHVGDSRVYRISDGKISQLTEDHSIVAQWQRKGWITEEQAREHPERSLLYRALGVGAEVAVDVIDQVSVNDGDWFILCTDGLSNHVEDDEIRNMVRAKEPQSVCEDLIALALERGGFDNVTVQAIRYGTNDEGGG